MGKSDVRGKIGEEQGRLLPHASPAGAKGDIGSVAEPTQRKADEEWLAFATEDPAFFIKPSDTV